MTIGIDLSSLQGAHRMRGIGYTLLNLLNNISAEDRHKYLFVFYTYPYGANENPLDLLDLKGLNYEVRELRHRRHVRKRLPGRLGLLTSAANQLIELRDLWLGDSRITDLKGVEFFLQTDQSQHLPRRKRGLKTGLVIYDIIPYVLEWEYMWSYQTARRHGFSSKAALRVHARRWLYAHKIKVNTDQASKLFAISEHTKQDFIKYLAVRENKIKVTPLGINLPSASSAEGFALQRYVKTSWGYIRQDFTLDPKLPFILYVGGADKRRRLTDLVAAFNLLRAQGEDFRLVLAGDTMQGPDNIANEEVQHALKTSSYKDDIIFMGFVDDRTRDYLYSHALVFVFPSRYEGFGLPVLEAMSYGTPVISYDNAAVREVAGSCPVYVNNLLELADAMKKYLSYDAKDLKSERSKNVAQANKWRWRKTSQQILAAISGNEA